MLEDIKKAIQASALSVEHKKYVMGLVFQDVADKQFKSILSEFDKIEAPKVELPTGEGAE